MRLVREGILYISLLLFMLSSIIVQTVDYAHLTNIFIVVGGSLILLITVMNFREKVISIGILDFLYLMFIIFGLISSVFNKDLQNLMAIFKQGFIYVVLVLCQRMFISTDKYLKVFVVASLIILAISIMTVPIISGARNYRGVFANPNSFGTFMSTFTGISFVYFISNSVYDKNIIKSFIGILAVLVSLYFVSISNSRTALLSIAVTSLVVILPYIYSYIKKSMYDERNSLFISFLLFILLVILALNTPFIQSILNNFNSKMVERQGNIFASRDVIWSFYLENSRLLGYQNNYLTKIIDFSAHNSFIAQIGQYGWLTGITYLLFWVIALFKSIKLFLENFKTDKLSILPIVSILLFIFMSMMEVMIHHEIAFIALVTIGYILDKETQQKENQLKVTFNFYFKDSRSVN